MKNVTNYFRNALLAAQYPTIEYKDKVFATISWEEIYRGCLTSEEGKKFWDNSIVKEECKQKSQKNVVIALKTVLIEYEHGGRTNSNLEDLTSVFFLPAYLMYDGQLCVPDGKEPWIPREFLAPMEEPVFIIGKASAFDEFLENSTDVRKKIDSWQSYLLYAIKLYESVTGISFVEDPFQKYGIRYDNKFYIFEYEKIDSILNLKRAYDSLIEDVEPKLYSKITKCGIEPSRIIQSSLKKEKIIGHAGQMGGEYPLSFSQREAISCFQEIREGEVLAVNGPPGTGKTTLLQSIVADMYVKAALKEDKAPIIVATSTNNQAVTNIIESFGKINPIGIRNLEQRWVTGVDSFAIYFPSSSKIDEAKKNNYPYTSVSGDGFVEIVESKDNRKKAEKMFGEEFLKYFWHEYSSVKEAVKGIHNELLRVDKQRILCIECIQELKNILNNKTTAEYFADLSLQISGIKEEIYLLKEKEEEKKQTGNKYIERSNEWRFSYDELPWYVRLLKCTPCFKKRIEAWRYGYMDYDELHFLSRDMSIDEIIEVYHKKIQENDECLRNIRTEIENKEVELEKYIKEEEKMYKKIANLADIFWEFNEYQVSISEESLLEDVNIDKLNELLDRVRYAEFWLAVHYYEAVWLATPNEISEKQKGRNFEKVLDIMYHRIAMLSPCMVMTCFMLPKQFWAYDSNENYSYNMYEYADLLIVDEAGQISPEIGVIAFAFAKKAVVVGDEQQIPPVWSIRRALDISMALKNGVIKKREQYRILEKIGINCSQSSIMKIASLSSPFEKYGKGLFLSEHRRCYNEIVQYCNDLVYEGNLEALRGSFDADKGNVIKDLLLPMSHVQVDTAYSQRVGTSRRNKNEAEAIVKWIAENLPCILERYKSQAEIKQVEFKDKLVLGIITPFKSQSILIKRLINKNLSEYADLISVGTVHTFQGAERNIIIFSTVYGNKEGCAFINRNTNLMNVAVSRAKDAFLIFGDVGCLVGSSSSAAGMLKESCQKEML